MTDLEEPEIIALAEYYQSCGMSPKVALSGAWDDFIGYHSRNCKLSNGNAVSPTAIAVMNKAYRDIQHEEEVKAVRRAEAKNQNFVLEAWEAYPE